MSKYLIQNSRRILKDTCLFSSLFCAGECVAQYQRTKKIDIRELQVTSIWSIPGGK